MTDNKEIEAAKYKAELLQAELTAITSSKAYRISKTIGMVKNQIKSDPVGLSKKAARILLKEPGKLTHIVRSGKRSVFIAQSVIEQTNKYQEWILLNEPDHTELDRQRKESEKFSYKPLISIITPVYNPPTDVLEDLLETVLDQTYSNFELCLYDDYGQNNEVIDLLNKYSKEDSRVRFIPFEVNHGIGGASNRILESVKGEYIALLDHDDTLALNALYENVMLLNEKPYDAIYSDKDKIDLDGNRFDPLFKATHSPEMMLNVNYWTHLNVMRTSIVKKVGGWDAETNGAQDWDLFLKVAEESKLIGHIPKVLYHWRVIESSTAMSIDTKPYALLSQDKAIDNYLTTEKIPAKAYHEKTELFIKWNEEAIDQSPVVFIHYTSLSNSLRVMRSVRRVAADPSFVLLVDKNISDLEKKSIEKRADASVLATEDAILAQSIAEYCKKLPGKSDHTVIVLRDIIKFSKKKNWYSSLTGWLSIDKVAATSGRLLDRHDLIVDSGGLVTPDYNYFPLFYKYPKYYQSYLGNAEWVRNLGIISSNFSSTKLSLLKKYADDKKTPYYGSFDDYITWLTKDYRVVMSPQAIGSINEDSGINQPRTLEALKATNKGVTAYQDPFGNPNMSPADPMRLFADEPLVGMNPQSHEPLDHYQHDAIILADTFDISNTELDVNNAIVNNQTSLNNPTSVAWFLPSFDVLYAGLMNIFHFADFLATQKGLAITVYILKDKSDASQERDAVLASFPQLKSVKFVGIRPDQINEIGNHDIGIATQWATAYPLAKVKNIRRKCYFIQDNEPNFYPKGSISSLVELSYTFGFTAIANTNGLLKLYEEKYGGKGIVLRSVVNLNSYYPREDKYYTTKKPYKVFFYARPAAPRNAFELGIAGLRKLKEDMGADVEIITAGAPWDPATYGVEGLFTNLNKISYDSVPNLYRSVDAGLMFMFSGHPGVTASELMASGCPVVVNEYDDETWHDLYKHEETCLVTKATASEIARNIRRCLEEPKLRKKIIDGGLEKAKDFYADYEKSQQQTYEAIVKGYTKNGK